MPTEFLPIFCQFDIGGQSSTSSLAAAATVLGALIGAGLASAQLINAKENKTSEYRQAWTASLRGAISDYCGHARTIAGRISTAKKHGANLAPGNYRWAPLSKSEGFSTATQKAERPHVARVSPEGNYASLQKLEEELKPNWEALAKAYYAIELHFKPQDATEKSSKEAKLRESMADLNKKMKLRYVHFRTKDIEQSLEKVITAAAPLLKEEWENIKAGEPAYRNTKELLAGLMTLSLLIGIVAFFFSLAEPGKPKLSSLQSIRCERTN